MKRAGVAILLFLFVGAALFYRQLLALLALWSFQVWAPALSYEAAHWDKEGVVIVHPVWQGNDSFSASRLTLHPSFDIAEGRLCLELLLDEPQLVINSPLSFEKNNSLYFPGLEWVQWNVRASNGTWTSFTGNTPVAFDVDLVTQEKGKACLQLHLVSDTGALQGDFEVRFLPSAAPRITGELRVLEREAANAKTSLVATLGEANKVAIKCEKLSAASARFLQSLVALHSPQVEALVIEGGSLDAAFEVDLDKEKGYPLSITQFGLENFYARAPVWDICCKINQMDAQATFPLKADNIFASLAGNIALEGGELSLESFGRPLSMTDIQAHLSCKEGQLEHSLVTLQVLGLKGSVDIEWGDEKQILALKMKGEVGDLASALPGPLQAIALSTFQNHGVMVLANLKTRNDQPFLDGTVHIQNGEGSPEADLVHFGCELKEKREGGQVKGVPAGWFHAQKVPLGKFLSPFIFKNGRVTLRGDAEIQGTFDDRALHLQYEAADLVIESADFRIDIPHTESLLPGKLSGSHVVDFHHMAHQGTLPIHGASYQQLNNGLEFHDIQGMVHFSTDRIDIDTLEMECEGIHFNGELTLDYKDPLPGVFDLSLAAPTVHGKVSQVMRLLAHLDIPPLLSQIPLEGDVLCKEKGLSLFFAFQPNDCHIEADFKGMVADGELTVEGADTALRGLDMDVEYCHHPQVLTLSDIQGTVLLGKPRRMEEYSLIGKSIVCRSIREPEFEVDVAINDQEHELLRLSGRTKREGEAHQLILDLQKTHFSDIRFRHWNCRLSDALEVEQLECRAQLDLEQLICDLCRFKFCGLPYLSHGAIQKIALYPPVRGKGSLSFWLHPDRSVAFHLEAAEMKLGQSEVAHTALLKGSYREKKWTIDQLQWDEWGAYAEVHPMDDKWRFPFIGLKMGQALLLGLEGDLFLDSSLFRAKLKYCQADLAKLDQFDFFQFLTEKWRPLGVLNATGEVEWDLNQKGTDGIHSNVTAEVTGLSLRNFPLTIASPFRIAFQEGGRIATENIQIELSPQKRSAYVDVQRLETQVGVGEGSCARASFLIPCAKLEEIESALTHYFPDIVGEKSTHSSLISNSEGLLKGNLLWSSEEKEILQIDLADGLYSFKDQEIDLKNIHLEIHESELQLQTNVQCRRAPLEVKAKLAWPSCDKGELQIYSKNDKPLIVTLARGTDTELVIESVTGELCGCQCALSRQSNSEGWRVWKGQLSIDSEIARVLLPLAVVKKIEQLKLSGRVNFDGDVYVKEERGQSLAEAFAFQGVLSSDHPILFGIEVESLQAGVHYVPGQIDLSEIAIEDPAGSLRCPQCAIARGEGEKWSFVVPQLSVKNLKPHLLKETDPDVETPSRFRSLIIKRLSLRDWRGDLLHKETWEGTGSLTFLNAQKKNLFTPLFAIPGEIILRLGLDPHVLNPVTGTVDFEMRDSRFYLTKFKDMYSEGKGSKFYLAQSGSPSDPSWMDFDGNLSVNIRMKHYNLIFKIAELFTVQATGHITKPHYNLQKHKK